MIQVSHGPAGLTFIREDNDGVRIQVREYTEKHGEYELSFECVLTRDEWVFVITDMASPNWQDYGLVWQMAKKTHTGPAK